MAKYYIVHHNDVDQAYRAMKKELQREGLTPNRRIFFEKPSDIRRKKRIEVARRLKKKNAVVKRKY